MEENANKRKLLDNRVLDDRIESICKLERTISPDILVSQVHEMFKENEVLSGFCVVEDGISIGVITRNALYKRISGQYGHILCQQTGLQYHGYQILCMSINGDHRCGRQECDATGL